MSMKYRLCKMMEERGISHEAVEHVSDPTLWAIFYYNNPADPDDYAMIGPKSLLCDQDWMELPIVDTEKQTFQDWIKILNVSFLRDFGMTHANFFDYNWFDEFENDVTPGDAYAEWSAITENGSLEAGL